MAARMATRRRVPRERLTIRTAGVSRAVLAIAAAVTVVLLAFAAGYGYHRDELYFVAAGRHLAWAYADQGALTPLIARAMTELAPDSLVVLRVPSALAAGATVLLTGLLACELGGGRRAQVIAAACAAVAAMVLVTGHMLSTSTFDLLVWTAVTWLAIRALRTGQDRLWPVAGLVLGIGLLNKPLPAFLAAGLLAGVALAGPRRLLRNPYVWAGAAIALALWSPWIVWQAGHGWPQIDVSRSIAAGGSASSQPWWAVVPFQVLLVSPPLAPVWIAGLVKLFADPALRGVRFLACAWVVLAVVFMAAGGKPYYLAGLLPVLIAAGALAVDGWLEHGRAGLRTGVLVAALAAAALADALIALPVLPPDRAGPVIAVNPDVGETIGWPELARTVAAVVHGLPGARGAVIVARNYGEAGAIDRYGPALGLPRAYSGHNAYGDWGPPPDGAAPVVAIGLRPAEITHLRGCRVAARIDNRAGVDNDERGKAVLVCRGPRRPWSRAWPALRHLG
jgi:4-amino-4-deoxy-L-arabinose transferase-like glycosyltransferase